MSGKILVMIILERISEKLDDYMSEEQAGFRRGRSWCDQIFVLRNIIEQSVEWRRQLIVNFIDFKKSFDSIHRPSMWKILRSYGLPSKILNIIKLLYDGSTSCVRVGGTITSFDITSGAKKGDVLSPVLFNMVVDWITKRIFDEEDSIVQVWESRLSDLAYADDIALLSEDADVMNIMTEKLAREAGSIGLEINLRKSKIMTVQNSEDVRVELGEDIIGEVDSFEYLGSVVYKDEDVRKEVGIRIGKAGSIFSKMKKIWNSRGISLNTKIKLFNGMVIPILMHGSETWKGLKYVENRLRVFQRKIINIRWYEHVTERT